MTPSTQGRPSGTTTKVLNTFAACTKPAHAITTGSCASGYRATSIPRILDIGCGSGQFLYFLKKKGYKNARGIDLDGKQIEIAQALGLEAEQASIFDYLDRSERRFDVIAMLDIIEHFTREELFPLMEADRAGPAHRADA